MQTIMRIFSFLCAILFLFLAYKVTFHSSMRIDQKIFPVFGGVIAGFCLIKLAFVTYDHKPKKKKKKDFPNISACECSSCIKVIDPLTETPKRSPKIV